MMKMSPCLDCNARKVGCHAVCKMYIAWQVDREALLKKMHMEKIIDGKSSWIRSGTLYHDKSVIRSRENERRRENIKLQRKIDKRRMERARICEED